MFYKTCSFTYLRCSSLFLSNLLYAQNFIELRGFYKNCRLRIKKVEEDKDFYGCSGL